MTPEARAVLEQALRVDLNRRRWPRYAIYSQQLVELLNACRVYAKTVKP